MRDKKKVEPVQKDGMMIVGGAASGVWGAPRGKVWSETPTGAHENPVFVTETKEVGYSFHCERCGHTWSEKRVIEDERV